MDNIIIARELTKVFNGLVAVDHISFEVEEGEIFGFLGPNGAGKTTTINMLTTLIKPSFGEAYVGGYHIIKESSKVRSIIGLVPQDITVDDDLTGWENLMLQAVLYHIPKNEAKKRIVEVAELVNLSKDLDRKVETYSGGMRKRLEIACGLIHRPKILFLDEPTLGLDVQTRVAIWRYIKMLNKEFGMTIFLTTHYMEEADSLCDRIAIIDYGKIKALDTPENLKNSLGGDIIEVELGEYINNSNISRLISSIEGITGYKLINNKLRIKALGGEYILPRILEKLIQNNIYVSSVMLRKPTLDEVFLELTGRRLREEYGSRIDARKFRIILKRARKL